MPLTGLANAALDRVAPDPAAFARTLAVYGESDLLCYRAEGPRPLVARQEEAWDPIVEWARRRFGIELETVCGIMHRAPVELHGDAARLGHGGGFLVETLHGPGCERQ